MCPADRFYTCLRQSVVSDLPRIDGLLHRGGNIFDWDTRIYAMLIVAIDRFHSQSFGRTFDSLFDVFGPAVQRGPMRLLRRRGFETELRRNHHLISKRLKGL